MTAQQLKNAILQEAIQGRLVPQDPNDEPASALLERIRKEKEELVKEGKLKKKDLEVKPISEDEIPFEIPESWEWVRISTYTNKVTDFVASGSFASLRENVKYYNNKEYAILVRTKDFQTNFKSELVYTDKHGYEFLENSNLFGGELILPNIGASIGKVFIVPKLDYRMTLAPNTIMIRFVEDYQRDWVYILFLSKFGKNLLYDISSSTAQGKFNKTDFKELVIPVPPLAEQKRIVAKIEELLPKVEEYGKAQEKLNKLNEELPERLKKSILQEAIEGRLVPQDPNDEPASALLAKIREEKIQLVKEGKLKKKDLEENPISEDEIPFEIPESWEWCRLGDMVSNQTGLSYNKGDLEKKVDHPIRVLRGGNIQNGSWSIKVDDVLIAPEFVKKQNLTLKKNTFITPAVTSLEHLGKTALIEEDHEDIVAGGFVLYLLPFYKEEMFMKYLALFFQSAFYNEYCKSIANKSGQAFWNLSRQKLMCLAIPLPPLAEQKRIVEKIEQLFKEIDKLKK